MTRKPNPTGHAVELKIWMTDKEDWTSLITYTSKKSVGGLADQLIAVSYAKHFISDLEISIKNALRKGR